MMKAARWTLALLWIVACSTDGGPPAWQADDTEAQLRLAGFRLIPADTPQRIESMRTLPDLTLLQGQRDGTPIYVYADHVSCRCLWIGDQAAYDHVRRLARDAERDELEAVAEDLELQWDLWLL